MQVPNPDFPDGAAEAGGAGTTASASATAQADRPGSARPDHRWGFGAFFFAEAVFILTSVVLPAIYGKPSGDGPLIVLMMMVPTLLSGAVAVLITVLRGNGPRLDFGLNLHWWDIRTGLTVGAFGMITTTAASMIWIRWVGPDNATSTVSSLLDGVRLSPSLAVLLFLHVWLIAPICEELLYRGLLWGAMDRLRWSQISAFVLCTALFAIGHLEPERTALLLVIAIPIGVARMLTGRLTASVVAHQVNNFLPALGLLLLSLGVLG